jgi:LytS/YehU family sensor histidine kinase
MRMDDTTTEEHPRRERMGSHAWVRTVSLVGGGLLAGGIVAGTLTANARIHRHHPGHLDE